MPVLMPCYLMCVYTLVTSLAHKRTNLSLSQEKEELIKGLDVLESTRQWFSDRIEQVSLEEKQLHGHSREVRDTEGTCKHMWMISLIPRPFVGEMFI